MIKIKVLLFLLITNLTILLAPRASSQITPDSTLGAERSVVTPNGNIQGLPATLIQGGATRGVNLFQSFSQFNVGDGQRVYFANPQGIQNILSRITGGDPSRIFGTLGVDGKANLFFLNPNGIIFGPNARLDVAGSFFASTANSFLFDNGLQFSATNPEAPPLITVSIRPGLQFGANSSTISNTGNLQTGQDLTLAGVKLDLQGKLEAGKDLTLSATDTVKIRDTVTNPFIASAGEKLLLQGNQNVDIFALNHPNSGFFSGSDMMLRSANTVGGDAHYWAKGNFRIEQLDGNVGNLFSPYDPVIRASGDVSLGNYDGASLHILAGGSVTLGTVNITGADPDNGLVQGITLSDGTSLQIDGKNQATLDIRAGTTDFGTPGVTPANFPATTSNTISNSTQTQGAKITIQGIHNAIINGQVFLTNQYQPNTNLPGGSIEIIGASPNSDVGNFSITAFSNPVTIDSRGDVQVARGIVTGTANSLGGNINILSGKDINIGAHQARPGFESDFSGSLLSLVNNSNGGNISLKANGNINISNNVASRIVTGAGTAGKIEITSNTGNINLLTEGETPFLNNIKEVSSFTSDGSGGEIKLTAPQGQINTTGWTISSESRRGLAGNVSLNARDDIRVGNIEASSNISNQNNFNTIGIISNQGSVFLNNSRVSTNNSGSDFAGDISITARNEVSIINSTSSDIIPQNQKGIFSQGKFGRILIGESDYATFSPQIVNINNSRLSTNNLPDAQNGQNTIPAPDDNINAGNIEIRANQKVSLTQNSRLETITTRKGNAGDVSITTNGGAVSLDNGTNIQAQTQGTGNAGNVSIKTNGGAVTLDDRAIIFSSVEPGAIGDGGFIDIDAGSVSLQNNSGLQTLVRDQRRPDNQIRNAGYIDINALGAFTLDNSSISSSLGSGTLGNAGNISIQANSVSLDNNAQLQTFVSNQATPDNQIRNAGFININASDAVTLNNVSSIFSFLGSGTEGQAGNISIKADTVSVNNGSKLDNSTFGDGDAGFVRIEANNFEALNGGQVRTNATANSQGDAGLIEFKVTNNISLSGFRNLNNSPDSVDRDFYYVDENNRIPSGLFATTVEGSTGRGGDIFIDPNLVTIRDGARIAVDSQGTGNAGQIDLSSNRLILDNQGQITADTNSGDGGDITLNLRDLLLIRRGSEISTSAGQNGAGGNGGNINITSLIGAKPFPFIVGVENENSRISANALTGAGGRININATGVFGIKAFDRNNLPPNDSRVNRITAISEQGSPALDGVVNLNSPDIDINDNLVELPDNPVDASRLIAQRCQNFANRGSEFINTGRGGLPPRPDEPLNSDAVWKDTRLTTIPTPQKVPTATNTTRKTATAPIAPATTWVFNGKGEVTLLSTVPGSSPLFENASVCTVR